MSQGKFVQVIGVYNAMIQSSVQTSIASTVPDISVINKRIVLFRIFQALTIGMKVGHFFGTTQNTQNQKAKATTGLI